MASGIAIRRLIALAVVLLTTTGVAGECSGCVHAASATTAAGPRSVPLGGDRRVQRSPGDLSAGRPQAFPFRATRSGRTTAIRLYVAGAVRVRHVVVGIYSAARSGPARLLTTGSARHPVRGRWLRIGVRAVALRSGVRYWLAVLADGGRLGYRGRARRGCSARTGARSGLHALSRRWRSGRGRPACELSAYVTGSVAPAAPRAPSPPVSSTPAPTPTTPTPAPTPRNCVAAPMSCGYPDPAAPVGSAAHVGPNTACSSLPPSGTITTSSDGQVIQNLDISGYIAIHNSNVTINNVCIWDPDGLGTGGIITISSAYTGTKITNSFLAGTATGSTTCTNPVDEDIINESVSVLVDHDYLRCAAEPFNGLGTVTNSYIIVDGSYSGTPHFEDLFIPGDSTAPTDVEHNTLLMPMNQTAGIFGDDHGYGPMHNVTISNNLVASGGDAIDTGCNGDGNTNITVTDNRLSYIYNKRMPPGGSNTDPSVTTWSGNFRDDTLAPVKIMAGC